MKFKALTVDDIKKSIDSGYQVEITGFRADEDPEDTFPCVLKKIDLLAWLINGKVPNELSAAVEDLFNVSKAKKKTVEEYNDIENIREGYKLNEWIARESMVEPKFDDLKDAGIYLSQEQLLDIYIFQMHGVNALKQFRDLNKNADFNSRVEALLEEAVGTPGDN